MSTVSSCSTSKNNMSHHVSSLSSLPLHQVGHTLQVPEVQETDAVSTGWFPTWVATVDGRKPAATVYGQLFRAYPCLLGFYICILWYFVFLDMLQLTGAALLLSAAQWCHTKGLNDAPVRIVAKPQPPWVRTWCYNYEVCMSILHRLQQKLASAVTQHTNLGSQQIYCNGNPLFYYGTQWFLWSANLRQQYCVFVERHLHGRCWFYRCSCTLPVWKINHQSSKIILTMICI